MGLLLPEEHFWVVLVWNLALHPVIRLVLRESKGRQAFRKRSWKFNSCRISLLLFVFWRPSERSVSFLQAFLLNEDLGDSLDSVEALLKKHEDFEKSLSAQEEKITVRPLLGVPLGDP